MIGKRPVNIKIIKKITFSNIKTVCLTLFIIAGVWIIIRPWYNAWRFDSMQKRMMELWENSPEVSDADNADPGIWTSSVVKIGGTDAADIVWEEDINPDMDVKSLAANMDGILTIKKINYKAPILKKYSISNLNVSVCSVIQENHMGQPGNYVLAGHYSQIYGRHFNRLSELSVGDIIVVENKSGQYVYLINDIFTVMPWDVSVMNNDGWKKIITLITCDYTTSPTGRLIVRGELVSDE